MEGMCQEACKGWQLRVWLKHKHACWHFDTQHLYMFTVSKQCFKHGMSCPGPGGSDKILFQQKVHLPHDAIS